VTLWGDYGLAKSLILKIAVVMATREIRKPCSYVRMAELIENMRSAFDADNPSETSQYRLDWWSRVPVLAIDELDRLRNTPYADEQKFIVMDRRYEDALRKKTVTLIAMNSGPLSIDGYLADRMLDGRFQVIHLEGQSARPMMRYKGGSRA
jgi:DNA replication protein DnaC